MPIKENSPVIDERLYAPDVRQHAQSLISGHYRRDSHHLFPLSPIELLMLHQGFAFVENVLVASDKAVIDGTLFEIVESLTREYDSTRITTERSKEGNNPVLQANYVPGACPIDNVSNFRLVQPAMPSLDRNPRAFAVYVRFALPGEEPQDFEQLIREKVLAGFKVELDEILSDLIVKGWSNLYLPPVYANNIIDGCKSCKSFVLAAELAEQVGWKEYSLSLWEMEAKQMETDKRYAFAGKAMLNAGLKTEAKRLFGLAMEAAVKSHQYQDAANYATKAGLPDMAAKYTNMANELG